MKCRKTCSHCQFAYHKSHIKHHVTTTGLYIEQSATHHPGDRVASIGSLGGNSEDSSLN
jgi:hypothetical protein